MRPSRIAIFASGNGTNAEKIMDYFQLHPTISVGLVLSNNPTAPVLERARKRDIPIMVFTRQELDDPQGVLKVLAENMTTHLVLAGFLWLIPIHVLNHFKDRIVNIHPSLLPKFGGQGMYGMKVHQKVKEQGESETGITIHLVNEHYDDGRILFQASCNISPGDTVEQIAARVNGLEYLHYPRVIEQWITT
jgi:phosphoribosylglycinamide formyltransferase 1